MTAWDEEDALQLVGDQYCDRRFKPTPLTVQRDFDVSTLDGDENIRPNLGVPAWRGIWFPFVTRS